MERLSPWTQLQERVKSVCGETLGIAPSECCLFYVKVDGILLLGSFRMEIGHYIKYAFKIRN